MSKEIKEDNIVKKTCKELGLTYKQLGDIIGYTDETISKASRSDNISNAMSKSIELFLENIELKNRLKLLDDLSNIIKTLSK